MACPETLGQIGALASGRRLANTPGFVLGSWFFDQEWDNETSTNRYGLPESVREAMRLEKLA